MQSSSWGQTYTGWNKKSVAECTKCCGKDGSDCREGRWLLISHSLTRAGGLQQQSLVLLDHLCLTDGISPAAPSSSSSPLSTSLFLLLLQRPICLTGFSESGRILSDRSLLALPCMCGWGPAAATETTAAEESAARLLHCTRSTTTTLGVKEG